MTRNQESHDNKSIKKVIAYCLVVLLLIGVSFVVRFVLLLQESTYTEDRRYSVAVTTSPQQFVILSVDPETRTAVVLNVKKKQTLKGTPQALVGIPIDAELTIAEPLSAKPDEAFLTLLTKNPRDKKHITEIDMARLYFYTKSLSFKDIQNEEVVLTDDRAQTDEVVSRLLSDAKLLDEKVSIEIINAADVGGLGTRLERVIRNSGGNVISVRSAQSTEERSKILYFGEKSYTLVRIGEMLKYPITEQSRQGIADIQIVIGTDNAKTGAF